MSLVDVGITLAIIVAVLWGAHRNGQNNPVGTGKISRRVEAMEAKMGKQELRLDSIDDAVLQLGKATSETSKELAAMRIEMAGDRGLAERTWSAVDRLQNYFIQDAFDKRRDGR